MSDVPPPPSFPGIPEPDDDMLRRLLGGRSRTSDRSYLEQFMRRNFPEVPAYGTAPPRSDRVRREGRPSTSKVWTIGIPYGTQQFEAQLPIAPELVNWGYVFNDKKNAMIIVCATWDPADERRYPEIAFYDTTFPPRPTADMVQTAIFEVLNDSGDRALQVRLPAVYAGSAFVLGEVIHIIARPR